MVTLMHDTVHEQRALRPRVEAAGGELARYGLVIVVARIGRMKFTAYEAEGISGFVANSPLMKASEGSDRWRCDPIAAPCRHECVTGSTLFF